ncbi:DUF6358 family protein [Mucilaginibacter arboris]|uniref:Uncharacterized protein n=1 Tax=Mucilaginibacter arboris TaxID=2682090 RepID=A0A7K1SVJ7_9SPHI|nr:DUF6358 family protein [Mucilaginibacter arboris]MVN21345.1 hypothetical protein [Mucilaginibacter arboris]
MGAKLFLNILYNLGIILCAVLIYWSFNHHRYDWLAAGVFIIIITVVLKIRLAKEVRALQKKQSP